MRYVRAAMVLIVVSGAGLFYSSPAAAHKVFKEELQKKYPEKKITCNACHVAKQPKKERNSFGKLIHRQFDGQKLTKNYLGKKGAEKKAFETEVMRPEFKKAIDTITTMTYDDLIQAGWVAGIEDKKR